MVYSDNHFIKILGMGSPMTPKLFSNIYMGDWKYFLLSKGAPEIVLTLPWFFHPKPGGINKNKNKNNVMGC